jgi:hypothetical protein
MHACMQERRFVAAVLRLQAGVRGRRARRHAARLRRERAAWDREGAASAAVVGSGRGHGGGGGGILSARQRGREAAVVAAVVRLQAAVRGLRARRGVAASVTRRARRAEERQIASLMRGGADREARR